MKKYILTENIHSLLIGTEITEINIKFFNPNCYKIIDKLKEDRFIELMNGCVIHKNGDYVFYIKCDRSYFQQDIKNNIMYCNYEKVWNVFIIEYKMEYNEIQEFIKDTLLKEYNCNVTVAR